jgi:hypothetical protein
MKIRFSKQISPFITLIQLILRKRPDENKNYAVFSLVSVKDGSHNIYIRLCSSVALKTEATVVIFSG